MMATVNAPKRLSTGNSRAANAPDQTSTKAAKAKHKTSIDRVLRTYQER